VSRSTLAAACALAGLAGGLAAAPVPAEKVLPPTDAEWAASQANLREIGLACLNYDSAHGHFPNNVTDKDGKLLLSWRVALLPFLEQHPLYTEFKLDEPWDSDHNKKLVEKMPKVFAPVRGKARSGQTYYRGFEGPGAVFERGKKVAIASITDGCSNTALVVEAGGPVVWTKPEDLPFNPDKALPKLGGLFDGEFNLLLCDGSVRRVRKDYEPEVMKFVIGRSEGGVFDFAGLEPKK